MVSPADTRLVLDVMVGGLTAILRMVGYDTVYALDRDAEADDDVIDIARSEDRVIVTRDTQIDARYEHTVLLESKVTDDQLQELREAGFELVLDEPTRCSTCNGLVDRVEDGEGPEAGPKPDEEPVWRCRDCGQYYWKGSHWDDVDRRLHAVG